MSKPVTTTPAVPKAQLRATLLSNERFHSLDFIRGLAALAVVFWHWQHFFPERERPIPFQLSQQPLFEYLAPLYRYGGIAVSLFFCLSGFVFFWLYADPVAEKRVSLREFFVLRLSRLYPLHLLTLLSVVVGQQWMLTQRGEFFVYQANDGFRFMLQVLFISNWFDSTFSFNAPIWSVSIEMLLYLVFFAVCFVGARRWYHLGIIIFLGLVLRDYLGHQLATGCIGFFSGGVTCLVFRRLRVTFLDPVHGVWAITALAVAAWWIIPIAASHEWLLKLYHRCFATPVFTVAGNDVIASALLLLTSRPFEMVIFPVTILSLAAWDTRRVAAFEKFSFVGELSYSSYLIHFPLQLIFFGIASQLGHPDVVDRFFRSSLSLVLFFGVLIPLCFASFRWVERPAQSWLRRRLIPRSRSKA